MEANSYPQDMDLVPFPNIPGTGEHPQLQHSPHKTLCPMYNHGSATRDTTITTTSNCWTWASATFSQYRFMEVTASIYPAHSQLLCPKASIPLHRWAGSSKLTGRADIWQLFLCFFYTKYWHNEPRKCNHTFLVPTAPLTPAERLVHSTNATVQPVTASLCKKSPSNSCVKIENQNVAPLMWAGFKITQCNTELQQKTRFCTKWPEYEENALTPQNSGIF